MTLLFFQPPTLEGQPNLSPFCVKAQIMLTRSGIPFETRIQGDPTKGPKKKFPYISDDGVEMGDSYFIEQHLKEKYGVDFYSTTSPVDRAFSRMVQSAIEEKLYWVLVYSRWQIKENWPTMEEIFFGQMPPDMRSDISKRATEAMVAALWGQGMGRHSTSEVFGIGAEIIDDMAEILGDKPYFGGDTFSSTDASAYGALINFVQNPVPTPLKERILAKPYLCVFMDRMSAEFFPNAARLTA